MISMINLWHTMMRTKLLGTNWFDVIKLAGTNAIFLPITVTNGSVFFRLLYA